MKKMSKILLMVSSVMSLCILAVTTIVVSAATEGIYTYYVLDGKAIITKCDKTARGDIEIPTTLGGCQVTKIGDHAFNNCTDLTSIIIPDGITYIAPGAFMECTGLIEFIVDESNNNYCSFEGTLF